MTRATAPVGHVVVDSPIDELTLVTDGTALTGLYLATHRRTDHRQWGERLTPTQAPPVLGEAVQQLADYFRGERTEFDLPVAPAGTPFQQRVWRALTQIPYGQTWSYRTLAEQVGVGRGGSRAVGMANGRNPVSVVIPCHRVIGADGSLTGYGGGLERKRALLALEQGGDGSLW